jgi:hypothetical protein
MIFRRIRPVLFAVVASLSFTSRGYAAGTEAASFLDIPVGAGPAALGSAYTALATNAFAPVWNPAGLAQAPGTTFAGQHLSYLESIHYEYLGLSHTLREGTGLGLSAQYLGSGDIDRRNNGGDAEGSFSSHYAAYSIAFGQRLTERLSIGLTERVIDAKIAEFGAQAYATDAALLYTEPRRFSIGAVVANMGTRLKFIDSSDPLPLAVRLGGALRLTSAVLVAAEGVYRKEGPAGGHFGAEWQPIELIALRTGYRTEATKELSALAGFSTGLGIRVFGTEFDYAWLPSGPLGNAHYFSVAMKFRQGSEARRNLIHYTPRSHPRETYDVDQEEIYRLIAEGPEKSSLSQASQGSMDFLK